MSINPSYLFKNVICSACRIMPVLIMMIWKAWRSIVHNLTWSRATRDRDMRQRQRQRSRDREAETETEKQRQDETETETEKQRQRSRDRDREAETGRDRDRDMRQNETERDRDRHMHETETWDREAETERDRDRDREAETERDRQRKRQTQRQRSIYCSCFEQWVPVTVAVLLQLYKIANSPNTVPEFISPNTWPSLVTSRRPSKKKETLTKRTNYRNILTAETTRLPTCNNE